MDWRLLHPITSFSLHHHWLGTTFSWIEAASIPFMVVITVGLWVFARPGGDRKWKVAAVSGLAASALALIVNQVVHSIWDRPRPYESHAFRHPWSNSTDASFPSDHASASFAIAFAVLLIDPLVGAIFLVAALVIAVGRLFIGAHYPSDVAVGLLVGLVSALVVVKLGGRLVLFVVRIVERATDPVLARIRPT